MRNKLNTFAMLKVPYFLSNFESWFSNKLNRYNFFREFFNISTKLYAF